MLAETVEMEGVGKGPYQEGKEAAEATVTLVEARKEVASPGAAV